MQEAAGVGRCGMREPTVPEIPPDQRPRERLLALGASALTDAELVAVLLGSGTPGTNVLTLARRLLSRYGGLAGLTGTAVHLLTAEPGVGEAKAARLLAALTLAGRMADATDGREAVTSSADVARLAGPLLVGAAQERVVLVACGAGSRLLECSVVATGSAHAATFSVRTLLSRVLVLGASAFALAHQHPGGDPTPSTADVEMTGRLASAVEQVGVRLLDHVVVVAGGQWQSVLGRR